MKDPADRKERAYDTLGLRRDATLGEVNAAYARLAAKDPSRRQKLTNAWQCLRKPETRLEEDLWYYPGGDSDAEAPSEPEPPNPFAADNAVPSLVIGVELTDLADGAFRRDFTPLHFREVHWQHLDGYEEDPLAALPIEFEK